MESHNILVQYFSGTLIPFDIENRHDDKTSENRTRISGRCHVIQLETICTP